MTGDTFRQPTSRIRFKDGVITAGLDPYILLSLVPLLRKTSQDHPPVLLGDPCSGCGAICPGCGQPHTGCGTREDLDGRHRWIASVMAGRADVLAQEDT